MTRRKISPIDPAWRVAGFLLAPSDDECRAMLREVQSHIGWRSLLQVLTVPKLTMFRWMNGTRKPSAAARKAIWLVWANLLAPDRSKTAHDIATWGRLR